MAGGGICKYSHVGTAGTMEGNRDLHCIKAASGLACWKLIHLLTSFPISESHSIVQKRIIVWTRILLSDLA